MNPVNNIQIGNAAPQPGGAALPEDKKQDAAANKPKPKLALNELFRNNRFNASLFGAFALVLALFAYGVKNANKSASALPMTLFTATHPTAAGAQSRGQTQGKEQAPDAGAAGQSSLQPLLDAGHEKQPESTTGITTPDDVGRTAAQGAKTNTPANLGGVDPFNAAQPWQPAPYEPGLQPSAAVTGDGEDAEVPAGDTAENRREHDALDKPSLVFTRGKAAPSAKTETQNGSGEIDWGIGLAPGTKLRARLESAVNTAVPTPVVAVVEYNYERNGEIVIPAGAKVFGRLEAADRSGYVGVRFESAEMPDGSSVKLEAVGTDLRLRPLRGKVEGKNTGKNLLVRSLAGIGEVTAAIAGQGGLGQPLSAGDLLRERASNNIGEASDQTVANLALTERIVVSVPAGTEIYVVLEKPAKEAAPGTAKAGGAPGAGPTSVQELRQLLQLQKELNQTANTQASSQ